MQRFFEICLISEALVSYCTVLYDSIWNSQEGRSGSFDDITTKMILQLQYLIKYVARPGFLHSDQNMRCLSSILQ